MEITTINNVPMTPTIPLDLHSVCGLIHHSETPRWMDDEGLLCLLQDEDIAPLELVKRTTTGAILLFRGLQLPTSVKLGWDNVNIRPFVNTSATQIKIAQFQGCVLPARQQNIKKTGVKPHQEQEEETTNGHPSTYNRRHRHWASNLQPVWPHHH